MGEGEKREEEEGAGGGSQLIRSPVWVLANKRGGNFFGPASPLLKGAKRQLITSYVLFKWTTNSMVNVGYQPGKASVRLLRI